MDTPPPPLTEIRQDDITRKIMDMIEVGECHLESLSARDQLLHRARQMRKSAELMEGAADLIDRMSGHLAKAWKDHPLGPKNWRPEDGTIGASVRAKDLKI